VLFPIIPVGGMTLGLGHFLIIIIAAFLVFLLYRKYREINTIGDSKLLFRDPRILPVLLLIAGGVTPWYMNSNHLIESIDFNGTMYYFVPVFLAVLVAADLSITLTLPFGWQFVLLLAGILYWYPLTKIVTSMIAPRPKDQQRSLRHLGMITALCIMTLVLSLIVGLRPAIGIGLALSALLVWIIQDALQRMREKDSRRARRIAEGKESE
ncbi:MAG: hypothetical protein ACXAEE_07840, partial [Candidatus Thorarchaeota archaeon]